MPHDVAPHWLPWCIWSVNPASLNPSERRCGASEMRKKNGIKGRGWGGSERKLQRSEGQRDVPFFRSSANQGARWRQRHLQWWRRMDRNRNKSGWKVMNGKEKKITRKNTCNIISSLSLSCLLLHPHSNRISALTHLFNPLIIPEHLWPANPLTGKEQLMRYNFYVICIVSFFKLAVEKLLIVEPFRGDYTSFVCVPLKSNYSPVFWEGE